MKNIFRVVICVTLAASCNVLNINPAGERPQMYYDLAQWVAQQGEFLQKNTPNISKIVEMNGKRENKTFNTLNWKKELDLLAQADINRSALQGLYDVKDSTTNTQQIITYKAQNQGLHTQFLRIILDKATKTPTRIEAKMQAQNYLYETEKNILLTCKITDKKSILESYEVSGRQKMIFSKEEKFFIKTSIQ